MARVSTFAAAMCLTAAAPVHAVELSSAPDPARIAAVYGATLGMLSADVRALAPTIVDGHACVPEGDAKLLLLECGPYRMTAEFTQAGRAWHLRASVDMSAALAPRAELEAMLRRQYGQPAIMDAGSRRTMSWPHRPGSATAAMHCFGESGLVAAGLGSVDDNATPQGLPVVRPDCYPMRFAILAGTKKRTVRGLIVDVIDPRPRLAELPARSTKR